MARRLFAKGYHQDAIRNLYRVIDWLITLPKALEIPYNDAIHQIEEEYHMPYITTAERLGMERGMQQGMQQGRQEGEYRLLLQLLKLKFRSIPKNYLQQMTAADADLLLIWGKRILTAENIEDVFSSDE